MDMRKHITVVGVLRVGLGLLGLLIGGIVLVALVGSGVLSGDFRAMRVLVGVGIMIAVITVVLSLPGVLGGIGVLRRWNWARYLVMVLAVMDLFNIPIGTALGVYTLWVLLHDETERLFTQR